MGEHGRDGRQNGGPAPDSLVALAELRRRLIAADHGGMVRVAWVLALLDGKDAPDTGRLDLPPTTVPADEMLTVAQVANRLGLTEKAVYSRAARWPFTRKLSPKALRFSREGLERWLAAQECGRDRGERAVNRPKRRTL